MGFNFRKSVKIGGIRLNASKSGIGVSTGVKGARFGINSKGKSYTSIGRNGFSYRKSFGNKKNLEQENSECPQYEVQPIKITKEGCLITACLFSIILGFFFPVIFVIPVAIIFLLIIFKIKSNAFQKVANEYENMLQQEISDRNFDRIKEIFIEILQKFKTNKNVSVIFENTYDYFLSVVFSKNTAIGNKNELIEFYKNNMEESLFASYTTNFLERKIKSIANNDNPNESDFENFHEALSYFDIPKELKAEFTEELATIKKIDAIRKNGLKALEIDNAITNGKQCFYHGNVCLLKNRQKAGVQFFEEDKNAEIYILKDEIDIVDSGHRKIKISEIVKVEIEDDVLQLTLLNHQKPIGLYSFEMNYILEILKKLRDLH